MRQATVRRLTSRIVVLAAVGWLTAVSIPVSAAPASTLAPVPTITSMTVTPPARTGAMVTLTATVTAADGTTPAGSMVFEAGGAVIGSPVPVISGRATTAATLAGPGGPVLLSAAFSTASSAYLDSSISFTAPAAPGRAQLPLAVSWPRWGMFSVTISPGTVTMTVSGSTATGKLDDVTVTDRRISRPGWQVTGQESAFIGAGTAAGWAISGGQLGWAPTAVRPLQDGATLGRSVAPAKPGLGVGTAAATLAVAPRGCGFGTNVLSARLTLAIPLGTVPGAYEGSMTITFFDAGPRTTFFEPGVRWAKCAYWPR